ncbi:MAG: hypothetical protein AAGA68_24590 [Pseudomonadota bacterium]
MIQVYEHQLGTNEPFETVRARLEEILRASSPHSIFKVGLANRPAKRKYGHRLPKWVGAPTFLAELELNPADYAQAQPWHSMYVIYEASTRAAVRDVETRLIQLCLPEAGLLGRLCWNVRAGGGGSHGGGARQFVYVLLG